MGLPLKQLEAEAMELTSQERAELAAALIASLDGVDPDDDPEEIQRAWDEEILRRMAEIDAGTVELIPAEEVFAELRALSRR
jgi:putative addiction module component (TIGR02574 family)